MHVSPEPITTHEEAAEEREKLLDFFAHGLYCTMAHLALGGSGAPDEEALTRAKKVADNYLAAYEEWMVKLAAHNARKSN